MVSLTITSISGGRNHNIVLDNTGTIYTFGDNEYGQIGNDTNTNQLTIASIMSDTKFKEVSSGFDHSLAIDDSGNLYAWGRNNYGQLGDGTNILKSVPTPQTNIN